MCSQVQETPILDLKQDPPAPRSTWWRFLVYIAIGTAIGFAPQAFRDSFPGLNLTDLWIPAFTWGLRSTNWGIWRLGR